MAKEQLNAEQLAAVTATEGTVRVIAGAGSGKTRTLAHRFAYLVNEMGVLPSDILCVTFTNKAAAEMRRRIRALTGDNDTGMICTFHSFCVTVLSEEAHCVGYPSKFLVLDNADIDAMLAAIYEERGLTLRAMTFANARDLFEMRKLRDEPKYYEDMLALTLDELKEKYDRAEAPADILFYGYLYHEKKCFALDYNDLIVFTLHIFERYPAVREKWQKRLEYIMIDEFQDIDPPQYHLMRVLCGYHRNLFIVGDPDQTIYTWRGADVRYLLDFDREFPGTKTVFLNQNYRSTPEILAVANSLIAKNQKRVKKELVSSLPSGEKPVWQHTRDADEEAEKLLCEVRRLHDGGVDYRAMAVLVRSHFLTRAPEELFQREKIPYILGSGVCFYDRAEVKDALSYLRLVAFGDDLSFARVANRPKRNIGERRMKALTAYADENRVSLLTALRNLADTELFRGTGAASLLELIDTFREKANAMPVSELLGQLLDKSGYEKALRTEGSGERLDNLAELKQAIHEYEVDCGEEITPESYLQHVSLFTNADAAPEKDAVRMMTVHAAKGLEFPYVFVIGLTEDVFPSKKVADCDAMEEERRLCFVALTRAERGLWLSDCEGKEHSGGWRHPSRFLYDVEPSLLLRRDEPDEASQRDSLRRAAESEQLLRARGGITAFAVGDRVVHPIMGGGVITAIDSRAGAYVIRFDALPTERKISIRAKIEKE